MFRWTALFGAPLCFAVTTAAAQIPARPIDPVFVRAQALVSDGNGVAGRALIDSVIAKTPPGAPLYPEALFWRASLATNAADAESDYKHIVVDYPLAPKAEDALLRLAQLELARGDRDGALGHLQRIPRDYPRSKSLARASYWTARVLFEKNDVPNACAANANALAQADQSEVELRNQIQYQGQRCPAPAAVAAVSPTTTPASSGNPTSSVTASPAPVSSPATSPSVAPVEKAKVESVDTVAPRVPTASTTPRTVAPVQRPAPPTEANDAKPSIVDPKKSPTTAPKPAVEKPVTKPNPSVSHRSGYSVQVAAYTTKAQADKLVSTLTNRGYAARVDGSAAPFRVRIGRYATTAEAEDALRKIKARHMDGFVVKAPDR
jgi:cell division protein FtsN